ncbi:MAG: polysaccharide pyruvyl transferase family protein [Muribaculaceae bacterium]|nr:polysaccharide pyruvyl transferase family protein [Muribaculaceae bacterium]
MTKPTVGILSMQRVINYGSFLQAYALRELLNKNGAGEVYFIDIIPGPILVESPTANKNRCIKYLKFLYQLATTSNIISGFKTYFLKKRVSQSIKNAWSILRLDESPTYPLDLVIIGSDEVFNCCQDVPWGYSSQLFGDIPLEIAHKIASYAGSFGYTQIEDLKRYGVDFEIAQNLKKMVAVSVRDGNSYEIVKDLIGQSPYLHVDPVLAYGYKSEIDSFKKRPYKRPYIIIYSYQDRINNPSEIYAITEYARTSGFTLLSIFCRYDWCDEAIVPRTPVEVLHWFKYADCIITDTFHGTIFSIITHSKFATLVRESNYNKLHYLLSSLNLEDREVSLKQSISETLDREIDYSGCETRLEVFRKQTNDFLWILLNK